MYGNEECQNTILCEKLLNIHIQESECPDPEDSPGRERCHVGVAASSSSRTRDSTACRSSNHGATQGQDDIVDGAGGVDHDIDESGLTQTPVGYPEPVNTECDDTENGEDGSDRNYDDEYELDQESYNGYEDESEDHRSEADSYDDGGGGGPGDGGPGGGGGGGPGGGGPGGGGPGGDGPGGGGPGGGGSGGMGRGGNWAGRGGDWEIREEYRYNRFRNPHLWTGKELRDLIGIFPHEFAEFCTMTRPASLQLSDTRAALSHEARAFLFLLRFCQDFPIQVLGAFFKISCPTAMKAYDDILFYLLYFDPHIPRVWNDATASNEDIEALLLRIKENQSPGIR